METNKIIGTFVFRNDGDGCLSSKYFHGLQPFPYVEAAKRVTEIESINNVFHGDYKTVWIQENFQVLNAKLEIRWIQSSNTYELDWYDGALLFKGIGMNYGDLLVGAYWDVRVLH